MPNRQGRNIQVDAPFDAKPLLPDGLPAVARPDGSDQQRLASAFGQLAEESGRWADAAAKVEGQRAGTIAGNDPAFRPSGATTIRGVAHDDAATATYLNNLDAKVRSGMSDLYQKHQNDPGALKTALDAFKADLAKNHVFPELAGSFNASFERARLPLQVRAGDNLLGLQRDQQRASAAAASNAGETEREQLIRANPSSAATRQAIEDSLAKDDVRDQQLVRAEAMTAEEAAKRKIRRRRDAEVSLLTEQGEKLATPEAVKAYREELTKKFTAKGLAGTLDAEGLAKVETALQQREQKLRVSGRQEQGSVAGAMKLVLDQQLDGIPSNPQEIAALRERARVLPDDGKTLNDFDAKLAINREVKGKSPDQLDDMAAAIQDAARASGQGLTSDQGAKITYLREAAGQKRKSLARDPLRYALDQGLVATPPIRLGDDAGGLARQLPERVAAAKAVAPELGGGEVRYFTEGEKRLIQASVRDAGGAKALSIVKGIVAGAGADAPKLLAEIGESMPELALAGDLLARGGPSAEQTAREIAAGLDLRRSAKENKVRLITVPEKKAQQILQSMMGTKMPQDVVQRIDAAAQLIYQARGYGRIDPSNDPRAGEKLYAASVRAALGSGEAGGKVYGGVSKYSPLSWYQSDEPYHVPIPPVVRTDRFRDVVQSLRDDDLGGALGKDGKPLTARALKNAYPVKAPGGYAFSVTNPSSEEPKYLGPADAPIVVDIDKLEPELRKRVPDAYLGGATPPVTPRKPVAEKPPEKPAEPKSEKPAEPKPEAKPEPGS